MIRAISRAFALLFASCLGLPLGAAAQEPEFTSDFRIEDCRFSSKSGNPFFPLRPGTRSRLVGEDDGQELVVQITVLHATKRIVFEAGGERVKLQARVVEEREWEGGELIEVSRNYFARCRSTGDVFYFGEDVDIYEDGEIVSHDGAWLAGVDGAKPGVIMPGSFLLGSRYFQEQAAGAMDRAEHVASGLALETGIGELDGCVRTIETTPLEPGHESEKIYCPGVGLAADGDIVLEEHARRRGGWRDDDDQDGGDSDDD